MLGGCIDPRRCVQRLHSLKHCSTAFGCITFLSLLKWGHTLVGHGTEIIMLGCSIKSPSFCSVRYPCVVVVVRATPRFLVASSLRAPPVASTALECCEEHAAWWLHGTFVLLLLFSLPLQGHDTNASSLNLPSAQGHGAVNMRGACVKPLYSLAHHLACGRVEPLRSVPYPCKNTSRIASSWWLCQTSQRGPQWSLPFRGACASECKNVSWRGCAHQFICSLMGHLTSSR